MQFTSNKVQPAYASHCDQRHCCSPPIVSVITIIIPRKNEQHIWNLYDGIQSIGIVVPLTQLNPMEFPTIINWTNPVPA